MSGNASVIREIARLSSGTLAKVYGVSGHDAIDRQTREWVEWLEQTDRRPKTWAEAWVAYCHATGGQ